MRRGRASRSQAQHAPAARDVKRNRAARPRLSSSIWRHGITFAFSSLATVCLVASGCTGPEHCIQQELKYYDEALSRQLTQNGTRNSLVPGKGVCVQVRDAAQMSLAIRQVDAYFHEVADLLHDSCEERAIVQWAINEGLRFDVQDTASSGSSPGRRMFLLRSFSAEEVALNGQRLTNDAPRGVACPQGEPALQPSQSRTRSIGASGSVAAGSM